MKHINKAITVRELIQSCLVSGFCLWLVTTPVHAERASTYTYTPEGYLATVDGPRVDVADTTTYEYDNYGNRVLTRNALGHETRITGFDGASRPVSLVDPNGLTTQLSYDPRGRLTTRTVSDGSTSRTTTYSYDPVGNLTQVVSPDGSVLKYAYDTANRLVGLEDGEGNRIDYTLDAVGNRLESRFSDNTGSLHYRHRQVFNQLGRLIRSIDARDQATVYAYDANGNLSRTTDARLNPTRQLHDALDRLYQTTDALDGITRYTYAAQDNLTSVTDPTGLTTSYEYDILGNLTSQTSPDTGTPTYTYDEAGNRLTRSDARGITVSYSYDALNRLTAVHYPDSSLDVTYGYDQGANGIGRLTSMSDAQGSTVYSYNAFGEMMRKTRTANDGIVTLFSYSYSNNGRLSAMTYPSGRTLHYAYDTHGRLDSLTLEYPAGAFQSLVQNIERLPFGPLETLDYGNGLNLSRSYDLDYRLTAQTVPGILQSSYQYDQVKNIIQWQNLLDTGRDQLFSYDRLNRLASATGAYGGFDYHYDAVGNRTSLSEGSLTETYSYAPDSHRLQQILGATTDNRGYDDAGNTIQSLIGSYSYDDSNRMVGFTSTTGMEAEYAYNGQGERIRKTLDGTITRFRYGDNAKLLGEYDASGAAIREYVYLDSQPLALLTRDPQTQAEAVYFLHTDHLGAVVKSTDASQTLVWHVERRPFGERSVSVGLIDVPLGFPGQYYDVETGNYYNYIRDYDSSTGRYLQSDPIGLWGGLNTYLYVMDKPLIKADPYGLIDWDSFKNNTKICVKAGESCDTFAVRVNSMCDRLVGSALSAIGVCRAIAGSALLDCELGGVSTCKDEVQVSCTTQ
jgi:RHS repeat-associated protein